MAGAPGQGELALEAGWRALRPCPGQPHRLPARALAPLSVQPSRDSLHALVHERALQTAGRSLASTFLAPLDVCMCVGSDAQEVGYTGHLSSTSAWCQCVWGWCGEVDRTTSAAAPKRRVKLASNHSTSAQHSVGSCAVHVSSKGWERAAAGQARRRCCKHARSAGADVDSVLPIRGGRQWSLLAAAVSLDKGAPVQPRPCPLLTTSGAELFAPM